MYHVQPGGILSHRKPRLIFCGCFFDAQESKCVPGGKFFTVGNDPSTDNPWHPLRRACCAHTLVSERQEGDLLRRLCVESARGLSCGHVGLASRLDASRRASKRQGGEATFHTSTEEGKKRTRDVRRSYFLVSIYTALSMRILLRKAGIIFHILEY